VRRDELLSFGIPTPDMPEQSRIAAVLDTVDEAIAKTEAVIAKLKQVRAGLLHDLLTRGLDSNGQLRDPIAHPEQFKDSSLGRIPKEWEVLPLEQIADPQAPICYGIVQVLDHMTDGVPVVAIRDMLGDYSTGLHRTSPNIDANYARSRVLPGDVLISVKGTIGRIGLVPQHYRGNISRDIARIRPAEGVASGFLVHLLRSPLGQRRLELAQVGTTRAELSIAPLKRLPFTFPLTAEQKAISGILDRQDRLISAHEVEGAKLRQLKSGLMADLLNGRVRVPEIATS
jgi:type I restriction enzyme, S subunit